jgi:hypothetical protein
VRCDAAAIVDRAPFIAVSNVMVSSALINAAHVTTHVHAAI